MSAHSSLFRTEKVGGIRTGSSRTSWPSTIERGSERVSERARARKERRERADPADVDELVDAVLGECGSWGQLEGRTEAVLIRRLTLLSSENIAGDMGARRRELGCSWTDALWAAQSASAVWI